MWRPLSPMRVHAASLPLGCSCGRASSADETPARALTVVTQIRVLPEVRRGPLQMSLILVGFKGPWAQGLSNDCTVPPRVQGSGCRQPCRPWGPGGHSQAWACPMSYL